MLSNHKEVVYTNSSFHWEPMGCLVYKYFTEDLEILNFF